MDEKGEGRNFKTSPFSLPRPLQKRSGHPTQFLGDRTGLLYVARLVDLPDERLPALAFWINVPREFRVQGRIMAVSCRLLPLSELRLQADLRTQDSLLGMLVGLSDSR